jgi:hypothetical protein
LNFEILIVLDHNDVTWDGSKGGEFWRTGEKEKKMRHGVFREN